MPERDAIPDEKVLAAVCRAQLHMQISEGAPLPRIKQHLGLRHTGWTTQQLRPQIDALVAAGLLTHVWRRSRDWWKVTPPGKRRAAPFSELPESPQHSAWRRARVLAEQEIERVWTRALGCVEKAEDALNDSKPTASAYRALGDRLKVAFEDLASATYCLNEWPEPDDEHADVETWDVKGLRRTHWSSEHEAMPLSSRGRRPVLSRGLSRAIRELRTVDAAQFAVDAGIPGWKLEALEQGRFSPGAGMLIRLAEAMNVKTSDLLRRAEVLDAEK
jgi:hypothetical protein